MATVPCTFFSAPPYAYPSAAAYPATASGFSTAPVSAFPPAFPCAATYPYPHSASAYPAYESSSYYSAATYHHPVHSTFPSPIPSQIDPYRPPPDPTPTHGDLYPVHPSAPSAGAPAISFLPDHGSSSPAYHTPFNHPPVQAAPQLHPPQSHTSEPIPFPFPSTTTEPPTKLLASRATSARAPDGHTVLELHTHEVPRTAEKGNTFHRVPPESISQGNVLPEGNSKRRGADQLTRMEDDAVLKGATDERVPAKDAIRHRQQRELLNIENRLDQQQARERTSFDTIQAPAYVARQVFDEMPQSYGLCNLNRQSIIRANGTVHSYFSLPEDYPLELATPPMRPSSAENVGVTSQPSVAAQAAGLARVPCSKANNTVGYDSLSVDILQLSTTAQDASNVGNEMPDYDIYEEDNSCLHGMDEQLAKCLHKSSGNAFSEQLFKCFSKAPETEQTSACLYYNTDVSDHALEQQHHDEKASGNVQQLRGSQLNVLVTPERRKEWDPGVDCFVQPVDLKQFNLHPTVNNIEVDTEEVEVKVDNSTRVISPDRPTDGIFSFTNEKNSDTEQLDVYFNNDSDNVFSEEAINLTFSHAPGIHSEQSIKLQNEKSNQATSIQCVHEANMHCPDERSELNIKKQNVFINKNSISDSKSDASFLKSDLSTRQHPCDLNNDKEGLLRYAFSCSQCPVLAHLRYQSLSSTLCIWDPGIGTPSLRYLWLQGLTLRIATEKPLYWLQIPELATSQSQVNSASYIWDPGTMLFQYKFIWLLLFTEEKEMVTLIPEQWSFLFNAMQYCQVFQKCNASSFQQYSRQDINFCGIPLWLINFQVS